MKRKHFFLLSTFLLSIFFLSFASNNTVWRSFPAEYDGYIMATGFVEKPPSNANKFKKGLLSIPVVATIYGAINLVKNAFSGSPNSQKTSSHYQNKSSKRYDIGKLYDRLQTFNAASLYSNRSSFEQNWVDMGLHRLNPNEQNELQRLLSQEECKRNQIRQKQQQQKIHSPKKIEDPQKTLQKKVQQQFLNSKKEIENYQLNICHKNQKRANAARQAIENNFRMRLQRYNLSAQTKQLLRKNNIHSAQFQECIGNDIQQQIHQEFIDVLNNGAALYSYQDVNDLTDHWYNILGNTSSLGCTINNIGYYSLAHDLADICEALYQIEENRAAFSFDSSGEVDIKELWEASASYIIKAWQKGAATLANYNEGVLEKAAWPIRWLTEFTDTLQTNPKVVFETAENLLLNALECVYDTIRAVEGIDRDPFCPNTQKRVVTLQEKWVHPAREKVLHAADVFWQMPFKEKTQEVLAVGVQVVLIVSAAKLAATIPATAASMKASTLLRLNNLSKISGPVLRTGTTVGGQAFVVLQVSGAVSTPAVVETEAVIGAAKIACPAFVDTLCHFAVAAKESVASAVRSGSETSYEASGNITPETIRAIENGKIDVIPKGQSKPIRVKIKDGKLQPRYSFLPSHNKLEKLVKRFNEKIGNPQCFEKAGIRKIKNVEKLIKHSLGMEHQYKATQSGVKQIDKGMHFLHRLRLVDTGKISIQNQHVRPITKVVECDIFMNGQWTQKTLWPTHWKTEQIVDKTIESLHNISRQFIDKGRVVFEGKTDCGVKIRTVLETDGTGVSVYPL